MKLLNILILDGEIERVWVFSLSPVLPTINIKYIDPCTWAVYVDI